MNRIIFALSLLLFSVCVSPAQTQVTGPTPGSMALAPARFELEMKPGTETTVVVNLDYRSGLNADQPVRIVASLNDWTITKEGRVDYFRPNSTLNSACPWLIYSPGEASVTPGKIHQIRVTISVPADATPGDHLAALIVEQRPETIKYDQNVRQMIVRYRMASVFYIKVPGLTKKGNVEDLYAEATPDGVVVTPRLKNEGNSMIRPVATVTVVDADGKTVAELPAFEPLPILGGSETKQAVRLDTALSPGSYTVRYRVDFQDGGKVTEGVTDLVVKPFPKIAAAAKPTPKP